jgi:hypothetical protein
MNDPDRIVVYRSRNSGSHTWTAREHVAVQTLARDLVARAWAYARQSDEPTWEDYPDLAEHDWQAVLDEAERLIPESQPDTRGPAIAVLAPRAERGA